MTPGTYDFPAHRRGDTFNGHQIEINQNGAPVDLSGAAIKIQFRTRYAQRLALEWSTADSSITVSGASNNVIEMSAKTGDQMNIGPGIYTYDIQVILPSGVTNTYVEGSMEIINDVTR